MTISKPRKKNFSSFTPIYETAAHAIGDLEVVLGWLHYIFQNCEHNLVSKE